MSSIQQENAKALCMNLAPLVGCKLNSNKWSPAVARFICEDSGLVISSNGLTNLVEETFNQGNVSYGFTPRLSVEDYYIYNQVKSYQDSVLDASYIETTNYASSEMDSHTALQITAKMSQIYDSTLFTFLMDCKELQFTLINRQLCMVILGCFTIRYHLWIFAQSNVKNSILSKTYLQRLVSNIDYLKVLFSSMEEPSYKSTLYVTICNELLILKKNLLQIVKAVVE